MLGLKYQFEHVGPVIDEQSKEFVKKWHYSKSVRGQQQKHVFKLIDIETKELVGICIYGKPVTRHSNNETLELRRLCLIDNTPRNTESFFIAKTLKWLGRNTDYVKIISFADPNFGHEGTIYKASNFEIDGYSQGVNPQVLLYKNKRIHMRNVYQKKNGKYIEASLEYQKAMKSGEAKLLKLQKKIRYVYWLR